MAAGINSLRDQEMIEGIVVRIHTAGLAYATDVPGDRAFAFRFSKIRGYRGESPAEVGLRVGSHVRLSLVNDQVVSVDLQ